MNNLDLYESRQRGTPDFPIELYRVERGNERYIMPFHWHEEFEIIRVEEGSFRLMIDETEYILSGGDIALIAGGQLHGGIPDDCVYNCIVFDTSMLCEKGMPPCVEKIRVASDSRRSNLSSYFPSGNSEIHRIVNALIESLAETKAEFQLTVLGLLFSFYADLYRIGAVTSNSQEAQERFSGEKRLKAVLKWMKDNYQEPVSLETLAGIAEMNPRYFCEFFKKCTHRSPIEYLNLYRIDCACSMLKNPSCSVTEAAFACGYNNLSYFVKIFKRCKGMTPKQYKIKYMKFLNGE